MTSTKDGIWKNKPLLDCSHHPFCLCCFLYWHMSHPSCSSHPLKVNSGDKPAFLEWLKVGKKLWWLWKRCHHSEGWGCAVMKDGGLKWPTLFRTSGGSSVLLLTGFGFAFCSDDNLLMIVGQGSEIPLWWVSRALGFGQQTHSNRVVMELISIAILLKVANNDYSCDWTTTASFMVEVESYGGSFWSDMITTTMHLASTLSKVALAWILIHTQHTTGKEIWQNDII